MDSYTDADVRQWAETVSSLHGVAVEDQDFSTAADAAANLSSGAGLIFSMPDDVAALVCTAIEAGYGQALRDIRGGEHQGIGLGVLEEE